MFDRRAFLQASTAAATLSACASARAEPPTSIIEASVRASQAAEAALAAMPYGAEARPYVVTHRAGAYRRIGAELSGDGAQLAADLDVETARIEADAAMGVSPPGFIVDRTLAAIETARAPLMLARGVAAATIGAAITRQTTMLQRLPRRPEAGVGALPDGARFYEQALRFQLGGDTSPRAAFEDAQRKCAALRDEAGALLSTQGYAFETWPGLGEALRRAALNEAFLYTDDDAGRNRAIADMNATLAHIRTLLPQAFNGLENTPAEIRRMSPEEEARAAPGRREGAAYLVDLSRIRTRPCWTLPSVVAHETLPGHGLQTPLQAAANPSRAQIRAASGYGEGWPIYAEELSDELGAFADPWSRLGYVQWMLFRYARVLVDAGVHSEGWRRDKAVQTMRELIGFDIAFVSIEEDVDRICVEPGAYAAQGLSALHIRDEREAAKRRYGARFDLKRFHDAILRHGPLSPPGMEEAVRQAFA